MRIQDLERRTGLERATIRYYEREGLICPERGENGYRVYAQADVEDLMKIKLLRQLGMSLEQIRELKQGSGDFGTALDTRLRELTKEIEKKHQAVNVCQVMRSDGVSYQTLDAEHYLQLLRQPVHIPGRPTIQPGEFKETVPKEVHPWRRYIARMLDYSLFNAAVSFVLFFLLRLRPIPDGILETLLSWGLWFVWMPIEALEIHLFGTTLGKWIMGIRMESYNGGRIPYSTALSRVWMVYSVGMGWGIPMYEYWRLYQSYKQHKESADMDWDDEIMVCYKPWNWAGKTSLAVAVCCLLLGGAIIGQDSVLPANRGELTVSEFAENYNFYLNILNDDVNPDNQLLKNGEFPEKDTHVAVVYIGGQPEDEQGNFIYETEDGVIRKISYSNSWSEVFMVSPLGGKCSTAVFASVFSQKGMTFRELMAFTQRWNDTICDNSSGELLSGDVTIRWEIQAENCWLVDGVYYVQEEESPASLSLEFEIIFN